MSLKVRAVTRKRVNTIRPKYRHRSQNVHLNTKKLKRTHEYVRVYVCTRKCIQPDSRHVGVRMH